MLSIISDRNEQIEDNINKKIFSCIDNNKCFIFNAGAGSGKTYSLIKSLKHLVAQKGEALRYHNNAIICITYTNVAAEEIKQRLGNSSLVKVSTIHERLWDIIQSYQPQLVKIHLEKLYSEIKLLENIIESDKTFVNYQTLSDEAKQTFFEIMSDNKNLFYEEYNKSASEIKSSFEEKLGDYVAILKNIASFKKITTTLFLGLIIIGNAYQQ